MKYLALLAVLAAVPASLHAQDAQEAKHPAVFWNKMEGNYSVNVRSLGDAACAVDFIDLANERLVNLVQLADGGSYSASLIVGGYGAAPEGSAASLSFVTEGHDPASFDMAGTVRNADDVLQTIGGPLPRDDAQAILKADRITVTGKGKPLLDMAVPKSLRVQARIQFLNCYIQRM